VKTTLNVNHTSLISEAEQSLLALLGDLDRGRFGPHVALPDDGPLARRVLEMGIKCHFVAMPRLRRTMNPFRLLRFLVAVRRSARELLALAEREGADLAHSNSTIAQACVSFSGLMRMAGIPTVWHVRDMVVPARIGRRCAREATRIIAVSEAVRQRLEPICGMPDRWCVVHNGVDVERFANADGTAFRDEIGADPGDPVIGMIAQMVPWKRHPDFIAAAKIVHSMLRSAKFVILGDDLFNDNPDYKLHLLQLGDDPSIIFTGYREHIESAIAGMDVVVLPSEDEPFGRVLIEAGAASVPVVACDSAGPRETIRDGKTGLLVPVGNIPRIAEAIMQLASDREEARSMGRNAHERVCTHFTSKRTARKIEAIYDELLAGGGS